MSIELKGFEYDYGTVVKIAVASEGNRSFKLYNNSGFVIRRWAIDEIVFKGRNDERCDFLIEVQNPERLIYYWIELKGKDIVKACRQIINTIRLIEFENAVKQCARIITAGTNRLQIRSIEYLRLDNLMRNAGGNLKIYTNQGLETI